MGSPDSKRREVLLPVLAAAWVRAVAGAGVAGRVTADQLSPHVLAVALAFAGNAVLASSPIF